MLDAAQLSSVGGPRSDQAVLARPARSGGGRQAVSAQAFAAVVLAVIVILAALGFGVHHAGVPSAFDLDGEYDVPALWSGLLLLAAAAATWSARHRLGRRVVAVAVLFAFMGVDEVVSIHERLETATGVDWPLLYLPLIVVGGVAWLRVLRRLRGDGEGGSASRLPAWVWVLGAAAWGVAQLLEFWEWDGDVKRAQYFPKMYLEESLEMLGSAAWLLAMLLAVGLVHTRRRRVAAARPQ